MRIARPPLPEPSRTELADLWADLVAADAAKAYRAVGRLARSPRQSVPWLRERLRPVPRLAADDGKRLEGWLADLDGERFEARERATAEIVKLGESARPAVEKALGGHPSAEARRRLEAALAASDPVRSPAGLRALRAVEILECAGDAAARRLLEELAKGEPAARLTQEAKAATERLARRPAETP